MGITVAAFLASLQAIADSRPRYRLGGSGADGTCDCIGLIIGAIRRAGGAWTGSHGSNWAARNAMAAMARTPPLELGLLLYKAREPGSAKNRLPAGYAGHPDQRDYYHVGVVTSISPLRITHCTSWTGGSGIKVDAALGEWRYGGRAKGIDYDGKGKEGVNTVETARVEARSGSSVRMRKSPGLQAVALANVPVGARVEVLRRDGEWAQISYLGKTGWMLGAFLRGAEQDPAPEAENLTPDTVTLTLERAAARALMDALKGVV